MAIQVCCTHLYGDSSLSLLVDMHTACGEFAMFVHVCISVCIHVYLHICIYVHTYMHT